MRCTCGYTRFSERSAVTRQAVSRWIRLSAGGGFGVTPMGTGFGGTEADAVWGRFDVEQLRLVVTKRCNSCGRIRSVTQFGGIIPLSGYAAPDGIYFVVSDSKEGRTSLVVRYAGDITVDVPARQVSTVVPNLTDITPVEEREELPAGALAADSLFFAPHPEVAEDGRYEVSIVDLVTGNVTPLSFEVDLEASMQQLLPAEADLGGAPEAWCHNAVPELPETEQAVGSSRPAIPFDYCDAVLEYDARLGTLPSAQGWTRGGDGAAGEYVLAEAGTLHVDVLGEENYWEASAELDAAPGAVHCYLRALVLDADDEGLELLALGSENGSNARGARLRVDAERRYAVTLAGAPTALDDQDLPPAWRNLAASATGSTGAAWTEAARVFDFGDGSSASATELRARFGVLESSNATEAWLQRAVVSTPGRFLRAGFQALAPTAAPVLRFQLSRGLSSDLGTTACFKLRYGQSSDPYSLPSTVLQFSVPVTAVNQIIELPVSLSGLEAKKPFAFTLERDWSNEADTFKGTVFLHSVTVRSA